MLSLAWHILTISFRERPLLQMLKPCSVCASVLKFTLKFANQTLFNILCRIYVSEYFVSIVYVGVNQFIIGCSGEQGLIRWCCRHKHWDTGRVLETFSFRTATIALVLYLKVWELLQAKLSLLVSCLLFIFCLFFASFYTEWPKLSQLIHRQQKQHKCPIEINGCNTQIEKHDWS